MWAVGCIMFKMLFGVSLFKDEHEALTFENILGNKINFPSQPHVSDEAKDLIERFLQNDPSKRLGAGPTESNLSISDLKAHNFF